MMHWLIPANTKFYDVFGAFNQNETYWPINMTVAVGDIVYIYLSAPYKQIAFLCKVTAIDLSLKKVLPHIQLFFKEAVDHKKKPTSFMKLRRSGTFQISEGSPLSYEQLKQNGLTGMLMGARKLENNQKLMKYINEVCHEL
jgi:hypothetical protein